MSGLVEAKALAVGYNNLAEMYRANGQTDKAHEFAAKADRLAQVGATTARR